MVLRYDVHVMAFVADGLPHADSGRTDRPIAWPRDEYRSMLLCVVKGFRRCWRTSDGPLDVRAGSHSGHALSV